MHNNIFSLNYNIARMARDHALRRLTIPWKGKDETETLLMCSELESLGLKHVGRVFSYGVEKEIFLAPGKIIIARHENKSASEKYHFSVLSNTLVSESDLDKKSYVLRLENGILLRLGVFDETVHTFESLELLLQKIENKGMTLRDIIFHPTLIFDLNIYEKQSRSEMYQQIVNRYSLETAEALKYLVFDLPDSIQLEVD